MILALDVCVVVVVVVPYRKSNLSKCADNIG